MVTHLRAITTLFLGTCGLSPAPSNSQGWISGSNVNSFGIGSAILVGNNTTALNASAIFSAAGMMDIRISASRAWLDGDIPGTDLSSTGIGWGLQLNPINHMEELPVAVSFGLGHKKSWLSGDQLDDSNVDITGWSFAGTIRGMLRADDVALFPTIGVQHLASETTVKGVEESESIDGSLTGILLGFTFVFGSLSQATFTISPEILITDDGTFSASG